MRLRGDSIFLFRLLLALLYSLLSLAKSTGSNQPTSNSSSLRYSFPHHMASLGLLSSTDNGYRPSSLDVSRYPTAPAGLTLAQVHVFVRHGMHCPFALSVRVQLLFR